MQKEFQKIEASRPESNESWDEFVKKHTSGKQLEETHPDINDLINEFVKTHPVATTGEMGMGMTSMFRSCVRKTKE